MVRTKLLFFGLIMVFTISFVSVSQTSAEGVIDTPDSYWLKDTDLKISAYRRTDTGSDVQYLELFNDSDHLLRVEDWKISGLFGTTNVRYELSFAAQQLGRLKPKGHAVLQVETEVKGSSFDATVWNARPAGDQSILNSLEVTSRNVGWKADTYALKSTTKTVVDPVTKKSATVPVYDDFWLRAQVSGESYTATLSSFTVSSVQLFDDGLYEVPETFPGKIIEIYPYASECAPNDESVLCSDYIKIHVDKTVDYSNFVLRTDSNSSARTSSNTFTMSDYTPTEDGYITIHFGADQQRISLTNSGGYVWAEDLYGDKIYQDTMTKYESASSAHQGWAYMLSDDGSWQWTNTPQPDLPNKLSVPPPPVEVAAACPEGKYLNPDTNRCRTVEEAVNALAACPEGQERNMETNRCRSIVSAAAELTPCNEGQERNPATNRCRSKVLAAVTSVPCGEGQERNPTTNRCRSIASAVAELLPCDEGYERNPATNRCRKVLAASTTASATPAKLVEDAKGAGWNTWSWALVAVGATGAIGYGVYEWRHELRGFGQKVASKFGKK